MNSQHIPIIKPFIAKETAFIADLHGDHFNAIKYDLRPWNDAPTMWADLVKNWRRVVEPHWTVYALGDLFVSTDRDIVLDRLKELTGNIKLIPGNHDEALVDFLSGKLGRRGSSGAKLYWEGGTLELMPPLFELRGPGIPQPIWMCHYALESWHHANKGVWHLHGHTHPKLDHLREPFDPNVSYLERQRLINPLRMRPHRLNLCMGMLHAGQPAHKWAPQTWTQIVALMHEHQRSIVTAALNDQATLYGVVSPSFPNDAEIERRYQDAESCLPPLNDEGGESA